MISPVVSTATKRMISLVSDIAGSLGVCRVEGQTGAVPAGNTLSNPHGHSLELW